MATFAQLVEIFATGYQTSGAPVSGGTVTVYAAGTTTPAYVWYNRAKTSPTTTGVSSFTLDANGRLGVWADGNYKFVIKDSDGVTLTTLDGCDYSTGISGYTAADQYVADLTGAASAVAGITSAQNAGSHLLFQPGTYLIDTSTTITDAATVLKGATFSVSSGQTLTINGAFDAGLYQVFSGAGTVVFGVGAVDEVVPEWWGAVGDDDVNSAADNLAACQDAAASIATNGGTVALTNGVYYISDTWNMRQSNTYLRVAPRATLKCTAVTTHGQTVSFAEGTTYGGSDASQLENVGIYGGGTVTNTSSGTNENAIGFVRVKHASVVGMNIPAANRKAITAQTDIVGIRILDNNIGTTGNSAITVETGPGTTAEGYVQIKGNHIESAGDDGINVSGSNSPATDFFAVSIDDNIIEAATGDGILCFRAKGVKIGAGNEVWSAGERGIHLNTCENVRVEGGLVKTAGFGGVRLSACTGTAHVGPVVVEDANTTASTYSAISLETNTAKVQMFGPKVGGAGFVYSIFSDADYELFGGSLATGTSGYFGTSTPSYHDVLLDGAVKTSRRNATSAQSGATLSAANGIDYITVTQTGAQDVANITGTRAGQYVTLLFADGNSTMKDGTGNLRLAGDFAASDQDALFLISNGTQLHEISRSAN